MKNETFEMCLLFDFYGDMLTDKQKELFDLYYNEDLSLSEISENVGITRQGVRDAIVRGENTLRDMENKLALVKRYGKIDSSLKEISSSIENINLINNAKYRNSDIKRLCSKIKSLAETAD